MWWLGGGGMDGDGVALRMGEEEIKILMGQGGVGGVVQGKGLEQGKAGCWREE